MKDLFYAFRMMRKNPGFTIMTIVVLAIGIGANTTMFSVIDAVLLRPYPWKEPDKLVNIRETLPQGGEGSVSIPNLRDWRNQNNAFSDMAGHQSMVFNLFYKDNPSQVRGMETTANFFNLVGVSPAIGRTFSTGEDQKGKNRVAIISHNFWQKHMAGDRSVIGKQIKLNEANYEVIGVMPAKFLFPGKGTQLWVPMDLTSEEANSRGRHSINVIGRLKPEVTLDFATQEMKRVAREIGQHYPDQNKRSVALYQYEKEMVKGVSNSILMLYAAVCFVLLIACVNAAILLSVRAALRRREIAVRMALGADRLRLLRQLLTESVTLSLIAGTVGVGLSVLGVKYFVQSWRYMLPRADDITIDLKVLSVALIISTLTGVITGLIPALQTFKSDMQNDLINGNKSVSGKSKLRSSLVIVEIAASFILLVGASLLIKSFVKLQNIDTGMRTENVTTMQYSLPETKYSDKKSLTQFYTSAIDKLENVPGIQHVGIINMLPIVYGGNNGPILVEGDNYPPSVEPPLVEFRIVTSDYFRAMGIPLIQGRFFTKNDTDKSEMIVLVNQAFAKQRLSGTDPLTRRVLFGEEKIKIVGVVGDIKNSSLTSETSAEIYIPVSIEPPTWGTFIIRSSIDQASLVSSVKNAMRGVDPTLPLTSIQSMSDVISDSIRDSRLNLIMGSLFSGIAVILALIGIYSVISYTVTQSSREFGIRLALGAAKHKIMNDVLKQAVIMSAIGVSIGVIGALLIVRMMRSLIYGVDTQDVRIYIAVALVLTATTLFACLWPARRAANVDPMQALRCE